MKNVITISFFLFAISLTAYPSNKDACDEHFLERERLRSLIQKQKIQSISQIIASLPACYKANSVKIFKSASLQCATPKAPRVVIWLNEPKGKTRCTFNSGRKEDYKEFYDKYPSIDCRENTLECEHFTDDDKARFEFYEVKASSDDTGKALASHATNTAALALVSPVNPPVCMTACHRGIPLPGASPDPRPNMEKYPLWVGFYGGVHDDLFKGYASGAAPKEIENFTERYFPYKRTNPRYNELIEITDDKLQSPGGHPNSPTCGHLKLPHPRLWPSAESRAA